MRRSLVQVPESCTKAGNSYKWQPRLHSSEATVLDVMSATPYLTGLDYRRVARNPGTILKSSAAAKTEVTSALISGRAPRHDQSR